MYLVAFGIAYIVFRYECRHDKLFAFSAEDSQNMFFWGIVGLLLGARIGSCFFYSDAKYYLLHPWMMFWPFEDGHFVGLPGMSYHGGVIGCILGIFIYSRVNKKPFFRIFDYLASAIPLGYTFGRLGNFINGELYGRVALKGGMIFPYAERFSTINSWVRNVADSVGIEYVVGDYVNLPRYPSQLYEAFVEGILLFAIIFFILRPLNKKYKWAPGTLMGSYLAGYGIGRFIVEYFRQPDEDIGYVISWGKVSDNIALFQSPWNISKGQLYCFIMIVAGAAIIITVNLINHYKKKRGGDSNDNRGKTQSFKSRNGKR